jgi:uncharacterized protein (DUF488 family)
MRAETVWTVGHSTHSLAALVALLRKYAIGALADIRTVPRSRRHPQFDTTRLAQALPIEDIAYVHLPRLGGWRRPAPDSPNDAWHNRSFQGYADYSMTREFATGLTQLRNLAMEQPTAMMCSEALWWRCHRRLVADHLVVAGDSVCHISSDGRAARHELTPFAVVRRDGQITYPAAA